MHMTLSVGLIKKLAFKTELKVTWLAISCDLFIPANATVESQSNFKVLFNYNIFVEAKLNPTPMLLEFSEICFEDLHEENLRNLVH